MDIVGNQICPSTLIIVQFRVFLRWLLVLRGLLFIVSISLSGRFYSCHFCVYQVHTTSCLVL